MGDMSTPRVLDETQLIERYIEIPISPLLRSEPMVKGKGAPVWAIAGYLKVISKVAQSFPTAQPVPPGPIAMINWSRVLTPILNKLLMPSFKRVAKEYELEVDEVRAAWAYYKCNPKEIEAKLKRNKDVIA